MTDQDHYPVRVGALGGRYIIAALGNQRKARDWLVQATDTDQIIVQADDCIGCFDVSGANGRLNFRGGYFPHLALAKPFTFPPDFVRAALEIAHPLDSETDTGRGVIVCNTVRVIR